MAKVALKNFAKFTGKHLCRSLFSKKLQDACKFFEIFRSNFLQDIWERPPLNFLYTLFSFKRNAFFQLGLGICLIECQMLFACCLIYITIIILTHNFYLAYLRLFLGLGLFMSYLCDLLFIFSILLIVINHMTSFLDDSEDDVNEEFSNSKSSVSGCCLAVAWFFTNFGLMLLIKVLLMKKCVFQDFSEKKIF